MLTDRIKKEYYRALLAKNSEYEGLFFAGIRTTGVFCRPTCSARKPKFENCEFFKTAEEALLASYRPCKRCKPLSHPNQSSKLIQDLVDAVEKNPEKRWKERDFGVDASTVRRQFQKRFGMTFVEYARARRLGLAMKQIREGEAVIEAQISSGYESDSGFRDAFTKIMGVPPAKSKGRSFLKAVWIDTKLGPMLAIADEEVLYLLEFVNRRAVEREVERLRLKTQSAIVPGRCAPIDAIEKELELYFKGELKEFKTPVRFLGTPFQRTVWEELKKIPYGETRSYLDLAIAVGDKKACRAVAQANGANQLALIIPCHRVINANGDIGGYGGGIARKRGLLDLEKGHKNC